MEFYRDLVCLTPEEDDETAYRGLVTAGKCIGRSTPRCEAVNRAARFGRGWDFYLPLQDNVLRLLVVAPAEELSLA